MARVLGIAAQEVGKGWSIVGDRVDCIGAVG